MAARKLSLSDEELRRILHAFRLTGHENHSQDLVAEVVQFAEFSKLFGKKHPIRPLIDKLLEAAV